MAVSGRCRNAAPVTAEVAARCLGRRRCPRPRRRTQGWSGADLQLPVALSGLHVDHVDSREAGVIELSKQAIFRRDQMVGEFFDDVADVTEFDQPDDAAVQAQDAVHPREIPICERLIEWQRGDQRVVRGACELETHILSLAGRTAPRRSSMTFVKKSSWLCGNPSIKAYGAGGDAIARHGCAAGKQRGAPPLGSSTDTKASTPGHGKSKWLWVPVILAAVGGATMFTDDGPNDRSQTA